jgi:hypothetical protein
MSNEKITLDDLLSLDESLNEASVKEANEELTDDEAQELINELLSNESKEADDGGLTGDEELNDEEATELLAALLDEESKEADDEELNDEELNDEEATELLAALLDEESKEAGDEDFSDDELMALAKVAEDEGMDEDEFVEFIKEAKEDPKSRNRVKAIAAGVLGLTAAGAGVYHAPRIYNFTKEIAKALAKAPKGPRPGVVGRVKDILKGERNYSIKDRLRHGMGKYREWSASKPRYGGWKGPKTASDESYNEAYELLKEASLEGIYKERSRSRRAKEFERTRAGLNVADAPNVQKFRRVMATLAGAGLIGLPAANLTAVALRKTLKEPTIAKLIAGYAAGGAVGATGGAIGGNLLYRALNAVNKDKLKAKLNTFNPERKHYPTK